MPYSVQNTECSVQKRKRPWWQTFRRLAPQLCNFFFHNKIHLISDTWHRKPDALHLTCDRGFIGMGEYVLFGLRVKVFWRFWRKLWINEVITNLFVGQLRIHWVCQKFKDQVPLKRLLVTKAGAFKYIINCIWDFLFGRFQIHFLYIFLRHFINWYWHFLYSVKYTEHRI